MTSAVPPKFTLSVVSHGQDHLIRTLLADLARLRPLNFEVLLTLNLADDRSDYPSGPYPIRMTRNATPLGFGANHNAAFQRARGQYFVVVNPDIRTPRLDMEQLALCFEDPALGACAPVVLNSQGEVEDSARRFPTLLGLLRRVVLKDRRPDYKRADSPFAVDWLAGMFIVFRREAFVQAKGFDARRYFMYYEDVDLCRRIQRLGWTVKVQPSTCVTHDAQRASHRNLQHLRWHLTSAIRYLTGI